jgi:hypothetical protein
VTQPDTLRAVLRYVQRFGPRELIVTGGAGAAETEIRKMEFPALSPQDAIGAFTTAA